MWRFPDRNFFAPTRFFRPCTLSPGRGVLPAPAHFNNTVLPVIACVHRGGYPLHSLSVGRIAACRARAGEARKRRNGAMRR